MREVKHNSEVVQDRHDPAGCSPTVVVLGAVLLLVCVISALGLVLQHLGGMPLPGCGAGSPCAQVAESVWGRVPGLEWPVAYLGLAYFIGLLVSWLVFRGVTSAGLRWLIRFGVLTSIGFTIIMFVEGHVCQYCLATHAGNLLLWLLVEATRRGGWAVSGIRALRMVMAVFVLVSAVLAVADWRQRKLVARQAEEDLQSSTEAIIAATSQRSATSAPVAATGEDEPVVESGAQPAESANRDEPGTRGFTGRYRLGPGRAAIRVVMFTDYQCKECKRVEADVVEFARSRDDMSVSFKQYPMCPDCNRIAQRPRHPNACWAARAAEAAGILRGEEGFWQMHFWLFGRGGAFTKQELDVGLREMGYEPTDFIKVMTSDETLELIKGDVEEAISLGIWYTPTMYINGVELRGWNAPQAVRRAVEQLAATNPPALTAAADQPAVAIEKLIGDWLAEPLRQIPAGAEYRRLGNPAAGIKVVVFGDYLQPGTVNADQAIRAAIEQGIDVCYEYRFFPFNKDCNPAVRVESEYANACRVATLGEAAGRLGGAAAYWPTHVWLLENHDDVSDRAVRTVATVAGLDAAALLVELEKPEVEAAVEADARVGQRVGAAKVPSVFINGRNVPRWELEGKTVLGEIIAGGDRIALEFRAPYPVRRRGAGDGIPAIKNE